MDDKKLIERFLEGEVVAFDELVAKYKNMVFNICRKMLGDYEEALDVSQDIFIKVYQSLKNFRGEALFSTYLYRICLNSCKSRLAVLGRRRRKEAFSIDEPITTEEGSIRREFASADPNPRQVTQSKEKNRQVQEALYSLKRVHKEVLILKEIEGLKYVEIATVLNIDLGTVKSRLNRARQALRRKLEGLL